MQKPTTKHATAKVGLMIEHDLHRLVKHLALDLNCKEKDIYNTAIREFLSRDEYLKIFNNRNIDVAVLK